MRRLSFSVEQTAQLSRPSAVPVNLQDRRRPTRRLSDAVEEALRAALHRGNVMIAEDLFGVMESIMALDRIKIPSDRRRSGEAMDRIRLDIEARKAQRYYRVQGAI